QFHRHLLHRELDRLPGALLHGGDQIGPQRLDGRIETDARNLRLVFSHIRLPSDDATASALPPASPPLPRLLMRARPPPDPGQRLLLVVPRRPRTSPPS